MERIFDFPATDDVTPAVRDVVEYLDVSVNVKRRYMVMSVSGANGTYRLEMINDPENAP